MGHEEMNWFEPTVLMCLAVPALLLCASLSNVKPRAILLTMGLFLTTAIFASSGFDYRSNVVLVSGWIKSKGEELGAFSVAAVLAVRGLRLRRNRDKELLAVEA